MSLSFNDEHFEFVQWEELDVFLSGHNENTKEFEYSIFDKEKRILNCIVSDGDIYEGKLDDSFLLDEMISLPEAHLSGLLSKDEASEHNALCCSLYYNLYLESLEQEGFSKKAWFSGGDLPEFQGEPFRVIERVCTEEEPGWNVEFNGQIQFVYPDEVIPSQMKLAGCPYTIEDYGIKSSLMTEKQLLFENNKKQSISR